MLIHPYARENRDVLATIPGTHIIGETLGVVGATLRDPANVMREWTILALYSPVRGRALGGLRAKLVDQKGFVTFCNQRDLEVLLELASPGGYCVWLDDEYAEPGSREWFGLCVDDCDLADDLFDRELEARSSFQQGAPLPSNLGLQRRVHNGTNNDFVEELLLLWDYDPESGMGPDTRLETVERRWQSIERTPKSERGRLWLRL